MTRVIAGSARGRRLRVPAGGRVRPTADRVKEALFSSLGDLSGAAVADLFAGSGALGIEALSRGADRAVFVEQDRRTAAVLRDNLATAGVADRAQVVQSTVAAFTRTPVGGPFDLVLADPPYDLPTAELVPLLVQLAPAALREGARVVVERSRHQVEADGPLDPRLAQVLPHDRDRTYGETVLRHFIHAPTATAAASPGDHQAPAEGAAS